MMRLPEELTSEILSRLPAKTLIRFMSVCKEWYSLISHPQFISMHLSKATAAKLFLDQHKTSSSSSFHKLVYYDEEAHKIQSQISFRFRLDLHFFVIVGACRGLLCFYFKVRNYKVLKTRQYIAIWNPSIRKHVLLPAPTIMPGCMIWYNHIIGFGSGDYDDFKVVRILAHGACTCPKLEVEVYSLNSGTWNILVVDHKLHRYGRYSPYQTLINGRLHWSAVGSFTPVRLANVIWSFDLVDDVFVDILLPDELSEVVSFETSVVREFLAAIETNDSFHRVWVMKEYGVVNSWTKLYKIDFSLTLKASKVRDVIGVRENGEVVMFGEMFVSYDPESGSVNKEGGRKRIHTQYVGNHAESLVLVGREHKQQQQHCSAQFPLIGYKNTSLASRI